MANKKFSEFVLKTSTSDVSHIVGYNGAENVQITPANFVTGGGTGVFLPLAGGTMTGTIVQNGGNISFSDGRSAVFGTGNDLEIYHDGSNSYINDVGTGSLNIKSNGAFIDIQSNSTRINNATNSEIMATFVANGAASLYYDNSKKFETTSAGISVTGGITVTDTLNSVLELNTSNANCDITMQSVNTSSLTRLRNATNDFQVHTNGTLGLTIDSSQNSTFNGDILQTGSHIIKNTNSNLNLDSATGYNIIFRPGSSEKMRLDSSGNLGIGTSSPSEKLTVESGAGFIATFKSLTASDFRPIRFQNAAGNDVGYLGNDDSTDEFFLRANDQPLVFGSGSSGAERMRIDASGQVIFKGTGNGIDLRFKDISAAISSETAGYIGMSTSSYSGNNGDLVLIPRTSVASNILLMEANVGIGIDSPTARLMVKDSSDSGFDSGIAIVRSASSQTGYINMVGGAMNFNSPAIPFTFRQSGSEKMRIASNGNVGIGVVSSFEQLSVKSTSSNNVARFQVDTNGNGILFANAANTVVGSIAINASATAFNTSSDYRLKEDLQDFKGLDLVSKISVYDYKWKADDSRSYGVMAHELEEVLPQAVSGEKDAEEMQAVDYSKIVPLLVKSIQELKAEIEILKNK